MSASGVAAHPAGAPHAARLEPSASAWHRRRRRTAALASDLSPHCSHKRYAARVCAALRQPLLAPPMLWTAGPRHAAASNTTNTLRSLELTMTCLCLLTCLVVCCVLLRAVKFGRVALWRHWWRLGALPQGRHQRWQHRHEDERKRSVNTEWNAGAWGCALASPRWIVKRTRLSDGGYTCTTTWFPTHSDLT